MRFSLPEPNGRIWAMPHAFYTFKRPSEPQVEAKMKKNVWNHHIHHLEYAGDPQVQPPPREKIQAQTAMNAEGST